MMQNNSYYLDPSYNVQLHPAEETDPPFSNEQLRAWFVGCDYQDAILFFEHDENLENWGTCFVPDEIALLDGEYTAYLYGDFVVYFTCTPDGIVDYISID